MDSENSIDFSACTKSRIHSEHLDETIQYNHNDLHTSKIMGMMTYYYYREFEIYRMI